MSINILLTVTDNTDSIIKENTITLHFSPRHYFKIKLRTKKILLQGVCIFWGIKISHSQLVRTNNKDFIYLL